MLLQSECYYFSPQLSDLCSGEMIQQSDVGICRTNSSKQNYFVHFIYLLTPLDQRFRVIFPSSSMSLPVSSLLHTDAHFYWLFILTFMLPMPQCW